MPQQILIVGDGIGALSAAVALQRAQLNALLDITLVAERPTIPCLGGGAQRAPRYDDCAVQFRRVIFGLVSRIDVVRKCVHVNAETVRYDILVLCPSGTGRYSVLPAAMQRHQQSQHVFDLNDVRQVEHLVRQIRELPRVPIPTSKQNGLDLSNASMLSTSSDDDDDNAAGGMGANVLARPASIGVYLPHDARTHPGAAMYLSKCTEYDVTPCWPLLDAFATPTMARAILDGCEELCSPEALRAMSEVLCCEASYAFPSAISMQAVPLPSITAPHLCRILVENHRIHTLDLSNNNLGDDGFETLAAGIDGNKRLIRISLAHNGATERGVAAVVRALRGSCTLESLSLAGNVAGPVLQPLMQKALPNLKELDLGNTGLDDDRACAIFEAIAACAPNLSVLKVPHNTLSDMSVLTLARELPRLPSLSVIDLEGNLDLDSRTSLVYLIDACCLLSDLQVLHLRHTSPLELDGAMHMATLLQQRTCKAHSVSFDVCEDMPGIGALLYEGIQSNNMLRSLTIEGTSRFDPDVVDAINATLARNNGRYVAPVEEVRAVTQTWVERVASLVERAIRSVDNKDNAEGRTGEDIVVTIFNSAVDQVPVDLRAAYVSYLQKTLPDTRGVLQVVAGYPSETLPPVDVWCAPYQAQPGFAGVVGGPFKSHAKSFAADNLPGVYAFGPCFATAEYLDDNQWEDPMYWDRVAYSATVVVWNLLSEVLQKPHTIPQPPTWVPSALHGTAEDVRAAYRNLFEGSHKTCSFVDYLTWLRVPLIVEDVLRVIDRDRPAATVDFTTLSQREILSVLEAKAREKEEREKQEKEEKEKREREKREAERAKAKKKTAAKESKEANDNEASGGAAAAARAVVEPVASSCVEGVVATICLSLKDLVASGVYNPATEISMPCPLLS
eukprot:PhM_4_TR18275/c0_g2_i1/m.26310